MGKKIHLGNMVKRGKREGANQLSAREQKRRDVLMRHLCKKYLTAKKAKAAFIYSVYLFRSFLDTHKIKRAYPLLKNFI